jgi:hypothetical protein
MNMANKLVRNDLINQMIKHSQPGSLSVGLCMKILRNIAFENLEYAEMML